MRNVQFEQDQRAANGAANNGNAENGGAVPAPEPEEENRGLFPDPNDPDNPEFARWIGGAPII